MNALFPFAARAYVKNASSDKQRKWAARAVARETRQRQDDLRAVLELPAGRRTVRRLLMLSRVGEPLPTADAAELARRAGMQDVGLMLLADIRAAQPGALAQLIEEHEREVAALEDTTAAAQVPPVTEPAADDGEPEM